MQVKARILDRFEALSPTLQEAARFIVDHPDEVVMRSMRGLAECAGVQPTTLVRLARQLGYADWAALKADFAAGLGLQSERYGQRARNLTVRQGVDLVGELFAVQQQNLADTERRGAQQLSGAVRLLRRAEAVYVAGFRASFPIAYSFFYGYRLFRNAVHLIDGHGGLEIQLRPIGARDVAVVASFAPYSREAMAVVTAAKAAGAKVLALTDSAASPLALSADLSLLFSVHSPSFFPSVVAGVALTEAMLQQLVADGGDGVVNQIDRVEKDLYETGAYLSPQTRRTRTPG
jgi:DNA-binding MurR/RpiR family transcriptional regulator